VAELNPVSRFFVNLFAGRRSARRYAWVRAHLPLDPGATCLEIGCGNGEMAARMVDGLRPGRYVATDLDPKQVETARSHLRDRYPEGPPPPLELRPADMLQLPFPDRSFDVVFAFTALHHASASHHDFSGVPRALAEVDRALRPGGFLVYEEIVHKPQFRAWLAGHGYQVRASRRRWPHDSVVAQKAS
jgi:ubiquinone/menaquinone biosynthesis C-methylase UbiE